MAFNPKAEPCWICGRDLDECVCPYSGPTDLPDLLDEEAPDQWSTLTSSEQEQSDAPH
jgi:hypothetical protein